VRFCVFVQKTVSDTAVILKCSEKQRKGKSKQATDRLRGKRRRRHKSKTTGDEVLEHHKY
jgi:hypothetical protein